MKKLKVLMLAVALSFSSLVGMSVNANAAACPDPKKDGKTIGKVIVGKTNVDIKYVDYPAGGVMNPPASPLNAGLSIRHMPLSSPIGSSLIVWHVNYKGCDGKLNVITDKKVGYKFDVIDEKSYKSQFKIKQIIQVVKGKYKEEWFQLSGSRQLVFVTCTGTVVNRHYKDNLVIIAVPVNGPTDAPTVAPSTTPSPSPAITQSASPTPQATISSSPSPTK